MCREAVTVLTTIVFLMPPVFDAVNPVPLPAQVEEALHLHMVGFVCTSKDLNILGRWIDEVVVLGLLDRTLGRSGACVISHFAVDCVFAPLFIRVALPLLGTFTTGKGAVASP